GRSSGAVGAAVRILPACAGADGRGAVGARRACATGCDGDGGGGGFGGSGFGGGGFGSSMTSCRVSSACTRVASSALHVSSDGAVIVVHTTATRCAPSPAPSANVKRR